MTKPTTILVFLFITLLSLTQSAQATTEFNCIIDPDSGSGMDYASLSAWENALAPGGTDLDLTAAATKVFSVSSDDCDNTDDGDTGTFNNGHGTGTLVHCNVAGTQALFNSLSDTPISGDVFTCNTSPNHTITLSDNGDSVIAIATCRSSSGTADQTAVTIDGWVTSDTNYIKVWTDPDESYRHSGVWNEEKYRLDFSDNWAFVIDCNVNYVRFEGLQMYNSHADGYAFRYQGTGELYFSHNIVRGNANGSIDIDLMGVSTVKIWNNILYNLDHGAFFGYGTAGSTFIIYNNTVVDTVVSGIWIADDNDDCIAYVKNNLVFNTPNDYHLNPFTTKSYDYNMGEDDDSGTQTNYVQTSQAGTAIFVDYNNDDFHIKSTSDAKDAGTDLSSDGDLPFSDDIDGQSRPGIGSVIWDIGADEYQSSTTIRGAVIRGAIIR